MIEAVAGADRGGTPSIVVVEWRIRRGMEPEFLEHWATRTTIDDRSGLVGEFLSREDEAAARFPWIRATTASTAECTVFYNVGIWRSAEDFAVQVERHVDVGRPGLPFEHAPRRRLLIAPVRWRRGPLSLPTSDAPGVR